MLRALPFSWIATAIIIISFVSVMFGIFLNKLDSIPNQFEYLTAIELLFSWLRWASGGVGLVLLIFCIPIVWNCFWKFILAPLGVFPYINGYYDVIINHNWPVINKLLENSKSKKSIDPLHPDYDRPELMSMELDAIIKIGIVSARIDIRPKPNDPSAVIDWSRAISINLLAPCDGLPHRLTYVYSQESNPNNIANSDTDSFYGSALLKIFEANNFSGLYWSNRTWQLGLNTAGIIKFIKK